MNFRQQNSLTERALLNGNEFVNLHPKRHLSEHFQLHLAGSQNFIDLINLYGPGCLLFKLDLRRAYYQILVDLQDY